MIRLFKRLCKVLIYVLVYLIVRRLLPHAGSNQY